MFYNTVNLEGQELKKARNNVERQEDKIYGFFQCFPSFPFAAFEIQAAFPNMLITSVRRSLTDLVREGKLVKTNIKAQGPYGMANYCYKIK